MSQALIDFLQQHNISRHLIVFIISLLPVLELRGGLIAAAVLKIPVWEAAGICVLGNILPMPLILFFLEGALNFMKRFRLLRRPAEWLERKAQKRGAGLEKGQLLGLMLFVGIPLPGTGGWTGSLIASLLKMPVRKSLPMVIMGILMACAIMLILTYFIPGLFGF